MSDDLSVSLSPKLLAGCKEFFRPFQEQYDSVVKTLCSMVESYPIALCAVYGSMVKGVRPGSDIDIIVLLRDDYKSYGSLLDISDDIGDAVEAGRVNDIPIDLHVRSVSSFFDVTRGTEFKQSFSEANIVFWEDGVTIDRGFFKTAAAV